MEPKNDDVIKKEIEQFKSNNGGQYGDYYIGITKHIEKRLIENNDTIVEHAKQGEYTKGSPLYMAKCINRDMAVEIEQYFQEKGMEKLNKRSVGVEDSSYIYCYKMNESNKAIIINENSVSGNVMKKYIKNFDKFINGKETI